MNMDISVPTNTDDSKLFKLIIDQGVDSYLEAFTESKFEEVDNRLIMWFASQDIPVLIRRLQEIADSDSPLNQFALSWIYDLKPVDEG